MRFADSFHKRLHRLSKFNSRILKTKENETYEVSSVVLPTYLVHSIEFPNRFGYIIENKVTSSTVLKKIVFFEPQKYVDDLDFGLSLWFEEFKRLEKKLETQLKEVDEHESKLLELASGISKQLS